MSKSCSRYPHPLPVLTKKCALPNSVLLFLCIFSCLNKISLFFLYCLYFSFLTNSFVKNFLSQILMDARKYLDDCRYMGSLSLSDQIYRSALNICYQITSCTLLKWVQLIYLQIIPSIQVHSRHNEMRTEEK